MPEVDSLFQGDGGRCRRAAPLGAPGEAPRDRRQLPARRRRDPAPAAERSPRALLGGTWAGLRGAVRRAGCGCGPHAANRPGGPSRAGGHGPSSLRPPTAASSRGRGRGCCSLSQGHRRCPGRALSRIECCPGPQWSSRRQNASPSVGCGRGSSWIRHAGRDPLRPRPWRVPGAGAAATHKFEPQGGALTSALAGAEAWSLSRSCCLSQGA